MSQLPIRAKRRDKLKGFFGSRSTSQATLVESARTTPTSTSTASSTSKTPLISVASSMPTPEASKTALVVSCQAPLSSEKTQNAPLHISLWDDALSKLSEPEQDAIKSIQTFQEDETNSHSERMKGLITLTRIKQKQCEEKAFKFQFRGQEIILRDVAGKIIGFLNKFKTVGDVAVSFDPVQAALPWAGVRFLLQAAVGEQEQMGSLLVGIEKITYLTNRCTVYESLYRIDTTPEQVLDNFQVALVELYAAMLRLMADTHRLLSKHMVARAVNALFDPDEIVVHLTKCEELERRVDIEAGNCHRVCSEKANANILEWLDDLRKPISRIDENVLTLLEKMNDNEKHHILYWTSSVLYGSNHDNVCGDRTSGTCEWILEHKDFKEWQQASSSTMMWLHGTAGTGKTFLTSKVIDEVQNALRNSPNHEGFAFFYCNRNELDRQEPLSILRSILRQLSTITHEKHLVQKRLRQLCHDCKERSREPNIADCKEIIRGYINFYPRTTIVLDALDECDKDRRDILVDFFDEILASAARPVKIFISSRPDVDIKDRFNTRSNIEIRATDNQDDISLYVRTEMKKHRNWKKFSPSLQDEVVQVLETRGTGMFQWVYLQIKQLLELRLEKEIRQRLGKLPKDLVAAYQEIIDDMSETQRTYFYRMCQWVMAAWEPLESCVLVEAVCQDPYVDGLVPVDDLDENTLLEYCRNLLVIDSERHVWMPSHLSVLEFLETHLFTHHDANCFVAMATLVGLNDHNLYSEYKKQRQTEALELGDGDPIDSASISTTPYSITSKGSINFRDFKDYATQKWMVHARNITTWQNVKPIDQARLSALLKKFLVSPTESSTAYEYWCKCICIMKMSRSSGLIYPDLEPTSISAFAICEFGLYIPLSDWWEQPWLNFRAVNNNNRSLFALSVQSLHLSVCSTLIKWGVDPNEELSIWPGSPLAYAAHVESVELALLLIEHGADVNHPISTATGGGSALAVAAAAANSEVLGLLIAHGADVNQQPTNIPDTECWRSVWYTKVAGSPLATAAHSGNVKTVAILLKAGADVNLRLREGYLGTALIAAVYSRNIEVVKLLLDAGADVNLPATSGLYGSALIVSACFSDAVGDDDIVKLLIASGADPNLLVQCGGYGSALCMAVGARNLKTIARLIAAGAEVNQQLDRGRAGSALAWAISYHYYEGYQMAKLLLDSGADVNMPLHYGQWANAFCAAAAGRTETSKLIRLLLDSGADITTATHEGRYTYGNAICAALSNRDVRSEVIKQLIEAGVDVNSRSVIDGEIQTSLGLARKLGNEEILSLLLEAGATEDMSQSDEQTAL